MLIQARSDKNLSSNQDRISTKLENFPCNMMALISCDLISKLFGIVCAITENKPSDHRQMRGKTVALFGHDGKGPGQHLAQEGRQFIIIDLQLIHTGDVHLDDDIILSTVKKTKVKEILWDLYPNLPVDVLAFSIFFYWDCFTNTSPLRIYGEQVDEQEISYCHLLLPGFVLWPDLV